MPMYGLSLFFFMIKKKKGLWLSPSIMWQLPIGLACWRGIMPQGQLRHNVSLSGCHTGQWRRVSHRRPTHPWAVPLPSSFLWQWKAWCEAGGAGLYSGDWVSILCLQKKLEFIEADSKNTENNLMLITFLNWIKNWGSNLHEYWINIPLIKL